MKKKLLSIILLTSISTFCITGCGSKKMNSKETCDVSGESVSDSKTSADMEVGATEEGSIDFGDSVECTAAPEASEATATEDLAPVDAAPFDTSESTIAEKSDDLMDSGESVEPGEIIEPENMQERTAGLLTAGEWNDNNNWEFFTNLISNQQLTVPTFGMNPVNRIMVHVVSNDGTPVKNAKVELFSSTQEVIWNAVSDYNGVAYVFFNLLTTNQDPATLNISKNGITTSTEIKLSEGTDGQNPNSQSNTPIYQDITVNLDDIPNTKSLDLMFVFDTTGSMGDELSYLQTEFEDIAKRIADQRTRYSVNFYRDEGDDYVVKSNEFTYNTELVLNQLNQESAGGGGDYPEAVHQALYDGIYNHSWNAESVKLLFLILDAPPHSQDIQINDTLQKAITEAAKQGIRIIPVASSGVDKDTETFLRTIALLTGGTYTFLTDDSGIGESHLAPTIDDYQVENLNDCIVRIINTYYQ